MINKKKGNTAIAIAIVIAGLIIGAAVIFTNGFDRGSYDGGPEIPVMPVTENDWVYGNRDSKIKIVEYSDTECPFCAVVHPTLKQLVDDYDGQVAWVYRHFPIPQLKNHEISPIAALAAECTGELGGNDSFWSFINKIYELSYINVTSEDRKPESDHSENPALLEEYAVEFGVDREQFKTCMDESRHEDKVTEDYQGAVEIGVRGTPFNVVILDEEMNDEQIAVVESLGQELKDQNGDPLVKRYNDNKVVTFSGAIPIKYWKQLFDSILK